MREIIEKGAREGDTRVERDGPIREQSFESRLVWTGLSTTVESSLKKMRFLWADSLVSWGREADSFMNENCKTAYEAMVLRLTFDWKDNNVFSLRDDNLSTRHVSIEAEPDFCLWNFLGQE